MLQASYNNQIYPWISVILFVLLLLVLLWVFILSKKVKSKIKTIRQLRQGQTNLQTLFENSSDGIIIYQDNSFIDCNQAVLDMLGYQSKEKFLRQNLETTISSIQPTGESSLSYIAEKLKECDERGESRFEYLARDNEGKRFWIDIILLTITYNSKTATSITWRDISKQKKLAKIIIQVQKDASEANKAKSEFLANMSHEIRTPMNAIIGFTDILEEEVDNPKHKSFLSTIKKASNSLLSLINNILDLSKIEAGKYKRIMTPTNPYDLFNEVSQLFSVKLNKKDIGFELYVDSNFPENIIVEATFIRQILLNLLSNAIKFTDKGHIIFKALIGNVNQQESQLDLILIVEDTGIGIAEDQFEKIFKTFEQHKNQDVNQYQGTGLGLSISKKLVENLGGTITLTSEVNKGSCFKVLIPNIEIAATKAIDDNQQNTAIVNHNTIVFLDSTVLIVDDVDFNRELVSQIFANTKINILEATNGQHAIDMVSLHTIDLVIMDLRMPIMDGYEATKKIKKLNSQIPIIALSASKITSKKDIGAKLFSAYLRKPLKKNKLIEVLKEYLPYKSDQKEQSIAKQDNPKVLQKASQQNLIKQLNEIATPLYNKAIEANQINDIKEFVYCLESLKKEYPLTPLITYTNKLRIYTDTFDIAGIQETLEKFDSVKVTISNIIE